MYIYIAKKENVIYSLYVRTNIVTEPCTLGHIVKMRTKGAGKMVRMKDERLLRRPDTNIQDVDENEEEHSYDRRIALRET